MRAVADQSASPSGEALSFSLPRTVAYEQAQAAVRAQPGEATWERTFQEGAATTLEEAIDDALGEQEG